MTNSRTASARCASTFSSEISSTPHRADAAAATAETGKRRPSSPSDAHASPSERASASLHTHADVDVVEEDDAGTFGFVAVVADVSGLFARGVRGGERLHGDAGGCGGGFRGFHPVLSRLEPRRRAIEALQCAAGAHANADATAHSMSTTFSTSGLASGPVAARASSRSRASADSSACTVAPAALSHPSGDGFVGPRPYAMESSSAADADPPSNVAGTRSDASDSASAPPASSLAQRRVQRRAQSVGEHGPKDGDGARRVERRLEERAKARRRLDANVGDGRRRRAK